MVGILAAHDHFSLGVQAGENLFTNPGFEKVAAGGLPADGWWTWPGNGNIIDPKVGKIFVDISTLYYKELAAAGFNFAHNYSFDGDDKGESLGTDRGCLEAMEMARAAGLWFVVSSPAFALTRQDWEGLLHPSLQAQPHQRAIREQAGGVSGEELPGHVRQIRCARV